MCKQKPLAVLAVVAQRPGCLNALSRHDAKPLFCRFRRDQLAVVPKELLRAVAQLQSALARILNLRQPIAGVAVAQRVLPPAKAGAFPKIVQPQGVIAPLAEEAAATAAAPAI